MPSNATVQWLQHISHVQGDRMTPQIRQELRERIDRQRRSETMRRTSVSMMTHSCRSRSLLGEGLRQMSVSATAADRSATQARWASAQLSSSARFSATVRGFDEHAESSFVWRDADDEADGLDECAALVGAADSTLGSEADSARDLDPLLQQLRVEPSDAEELAAKFGMYETYGQELERLRTGLFAFYENNKESLPPAVAREMERQLGSVDSHQAMGIPDTAHDWFVYHMMKQAERNNRKMNVVLRGFSQKLAFLAKCEQGDCPVCLEPFSQERPAETLGCCHAVCQECWQHWTDITHARPFCPLCKHSAFMGFLASHQSEAIAPFADVAAQSPFPAVRSRRVAAGRWPRLTGFVSYFMACCTWHRPVQRTV